MKREKCACVNFFLADRLDGKSLRTRNVSAFGGLLYSACRNEATNHSAHIYHTQILTSPRTHRRDFFSQWICTTNGLSHTHITHTVLCVFLFAIRFCVVCVCVLFFCFGITSGFRMTFEIHLVTSRSVEVLWNQIDRIHSANNLISNPILSSMILNSPNRLFASLFEQCVCVSFFFLSPSLLSSDKKVKRIKEKNRKHETIRMFWEVNCFTIILPWIFSVWLSFGWFGMWNVVVGLSSVNEWEIRRLKVICLGEFPK